MKKNGFYTVEEERLNFLSHGLGTILAIIFLGLLLYKSIINRSIKQIIGFSIYGGGLIFMFLSSTLYHGVDNLKIKRVLRLFDHMAIFISIAGTYTPIALLVLKSKASIIVLSIIWSLAILGIVLKIISFYKNKEKSRDKLFLVLYLVMGWISIFLVKELLQKVGINFFLYILLGGILYSVGVYFYKNKNIKYNHTIWHVFILAGSTSMFLGIFKYLA